MLPVESTRCMTPATLRSLGPKQCFNFERSTHAWVKPGLFRLLCESPQSHGQDNETKYI